MQSDAQTISLHYVQVYGVRDRIDYSTFSTEKPIEVNLFDILPSYDDLNLLKEDFTILFMPIYLILEMIKEISYKAHSTQVQCQYVQEI